MGIYAYALHDLCILNKARPYDYAPAYVDMSIISVSSLFPSRKPYGYTGSLTLFALIAQSVLFSEHKT